MSVSVSLPRVSDTTRDWSVLCTLPPNPAFTIFYMCLLTLYQFLCLINNSLPFVLSSLFCFV